MEKSDIRDKIDTFVKDRNILPQSRIVEIRQVQNGELFGYLWALKDFGYISEDDVGDILDEIIG